tara:strand:+ start:199 stop:429 length:231 start_codon:yes stop_codon:yes gene_type:complete
MFEKKVKEIISKRFNIEIKDINKNLTFNSVDKWDSIGHINLMLDLEKNFDIELDENDTEGMLDYEKIISTLKNYIK